MSLLRSNQPRRLALLTGLLIVMAVSLATVTASPVGAVHKTTHNPGGGGGGSDQSATVEMSDGVVTLAAQRVSLGENKNRIHIQSLTDDHKNGRLRSR